ncbi:conserved hypothetical protein [Gloeothece citriformis PCC 7424]|uniref:Uncharacterized protein n=1 Tax=Gloeothece citriformis (strain PCC 7424) TaxID=65393 RepID=B7K7N1_GLOC7|nr:hypothetical protein [Gloeothece citriformis]ACK69799.1 conserved hypothetical protein [Gloeothece citriformis PCC 7424]
MAVIALKAWYLQDYEPIAEVLKRPHDLRLSRSSLLKTGLRADILDDKQIIQESAWFKRYLEGDLVEFYIEGSGGYVIANLDLISQEVYLTKHDLSANLEPIIYFSPQTQYPQSSEMLREVLTETLVTLNKRSRLFLTLEETPRPSETAVRLSDAQLKKIRKSLLFIADGTAIQEVESVFLLSSNVCVELGYAIGCKRSAQILLTYQERQQLSGQFPFDLSSHQQLPFTTRGQLEKALPELIKTLLQRFNLFS